jgi:tripartite-type tricarboxylate transporter receptor subunit TctC
MTTRHLIGRRRLLLRGGGGGLAIAAAGLLRSLPARAQELFPSRPIRIVVPFPAGGTTDLLARLFAQRLSETLGQTAVVENRGGGGGSIGADVVAKAPPDGHTLLFHNLTFSTTTAALEYLGRAPHSIERDFAPITMGANVPLMLLATPSLPVRDLREFVAYAKGRTDLFYGSTGPGSTMNLVGEILKRDAAIRMEHVPFRGAAPLVQDMLAGRIHFGGDQLSSSLGHIRNGALRPLATLAAQRPGLLPEVPTAREQGFANIELLGWNGFLAPAATPAPVLERLHREIAAAARHPEVVRRINELGAEPGGNSAAEFGAAIREQLAKVRPLVAELRMQVE